LVDAFFEPCYNPKLLFGLFGFIPKIGVLGFFLLLAELYGLVFDVKDASITLRRVSEGLLAAPD
jgi:hypothetical protein